MNQGGGGGGGGGGGTDPCWDWDERFIFVLTCPLLLYSNLIIFRRQWPLIGAM